MKEIAQNSESHSINECETVPRILKSLAILPMDVAFRERKASHILTFNTILTITVDLSKNYKLKLSADYLSANYLFNCY